jgi:hypothetical protein
MNCPDRGGYGLGDSVTYAFGWVVALQAVKYLSPCWRQVSRESVIIRHGSPRLDSVNNFSIHMIAQM